jgi:CDP-glucose 4,6-dehydratase
MVGHNLFGGIYKGKTCLITGNTGFKGSWLGHWLTKMGATVVGFSLEPSTSPNHFELLNKEYVTIFGDINDLKSLQKVVTDYNPEIIFHLAAQSLVRYSYDNPIETYKTNVIGTLNIFEAARFSDSVKAIVNITSDKCYENEEWIWGYRENDKMGGYDPYSSSKGCAELLTSSYRNSFFNEGKTLLASARSGNVIGGGDWSIDRLIPDIVKEANVKQKVQIRSPYATRPWQHVLEPLSGYLMLGWKLLVGENKFAEAWNFGPAQDSNLSVIDVAEKCKSIWNDIGFEVNVDSANQHEANLLMLDCSKADKILKWKPVLSIDQTMERTILWYKEFYNSGKLLTDKDIVDFVQSASDKSLIWTR